MQDAQQRAARNQSLQTPTVVATNRSCFVHGAKDTTMPVTRKRCNSCSALLPLSQFYSNKACKDGFVGQCKDCIRIRHREYQRAHAEKRNTYHLKWRNKNKLRAKALNRNSRLVVTYGINELEYLKMLLKQQHRCAICKTLDKGKYDRFHIDHCHSTKIVRGLLCHHCNLMLGNAKDSVTTLNNAIAYLKNTNE
jgi:hypothetical protein